MEQMNLYECYQNRIDKKIDENYKNKKEFAFIVKDLIAEPKVQQMKEYRHHYFASCYDHCVEVAYWSYLICKKHNLDYVSAARAGILHDLFLYDWRKSSREVELDGLHAFEHPKIALQNASQLTSLNSKEKDIILNHMWPVTFRIPKYRETFIITFMDKISALKACYEFHEEFSTHSKIYQFTNLFLVSCFIKILT